MQALIATDKIHQKIFFMRGYKVMFDFHLAELYQVETKVLLQAMKRNSERFPDDFMFQLKNHEVESLRSQIVTSSVWGGRRYLPYVFTEQGVAMLSSVLKSKRAVRVNIEIMRAFVHLRAFLSANQDLAKKVAELEKKYDVQFKIVFDALRDLMSEPVSERKAIGFKAKQN